MNIASYASTVCASLRYLRTPRQGQAHTFKRHDLSISHPSAISEQNGSRADSHVCEREKERKRELKLVAPDEVGSIRPPDQLLVDEKTDFS